MKQWQLTKIHEYMRMTYWARQNQVQERTYVDYEFTEDEIWEMCEWIREELRIIDEIRRME